MNISERFLSYCTPIRVSELCSNDPILNRLAIKIEAKKIQELFSIRLQAYTYALTQPCSDETLLMLRNLIRAQTDYLEKIPTLAASYAFYPDFLYVVDANGPYASMNDEILQHEETYIKRTYPGFFEEIDIHAIERATVIETHSFFKDVWKRDHAPSSLIKM